MFHTLENMLDDAYQSQLLLEDQSVHDFKAKVGLFEDICKDSHERPSEESSKRHSVVCDQLLEFGFRFEEPRIDMVGQAEKLRQFAVIERRELTIFSK